MVGNTHVVIQPESRSAVQRRRSAGFRFHINGVSHSQHGASLVLSSFARQLVMGRSLQWTS
jgi:hypothetical protein